MPDLSISKSVGRAFEILEHFRHARAPCSTRELEKALKYPYSSVRAIVKSLSELGYLSYEKSDKTYFPTRKLLQIGNWVQGALMESEGLIDLADAIRTEVKETTILASRNFIFCNLFQVRIGTQPLSLHYLPGLGLILPNSVVGRVLLAQMSDKELDRIMNYSRYWAKNTNAPPVAEKEDVLSSIEFVRKNGYLIDYSVWLKGVGTICYPIPAPPAGFPIVVGVCGPAERIKYNEKNIRKTMEQCLGLHRKWGT